MLTFPYQLKLLGGTSQRRVVNMVSESEVSSLNPDGVIYQNKLQLTPNLCLHHTGVVCEGEC
jgi:hypothetical protein